MGTTVTAAYVGEEDVAIAHVGDSRAYRFRDGTLERLTEDHSLVEELVRGGKLTEQEAADHPQRSIITRALGPEPIVEVDTFAYPSRAGDVFLLCSDGLTSMISEQTISQVLAAAPSLDAAAQRLIDEANEAGGRDNITVVLFRVEDALAGFVDAPTTISSGSASGAPATSGSDASGSAGGPVATGPEDSPAGMSTRVPLARTQGRPEARSERHFGIVGKLVAGFVAVAAVVFMLGAGGYLASRQLYFLGTNAQGTVVVYRGFPYTMPFGVPMYETFYVSGVPASLIPADRRTTLLNHQLRSQNAATRLINQIELGQISG